MTDMTKFYEAMAMISDLPKDLQDRFISEIKEQQRENAKADLNVGTIVRINHKKISPTAQFRITKINRKNVKCQKLREGNAIGPTYTVTPSLLEIITR
jgi:hypothetical protein|tara:strand:+ start:77 stop:370 length:294 start_codon:yes stop_codon:yes gene_type:complete